MMEYYYHEKITNQVNFQLERAIITVESCLISESFKREKLKILRDVPLLTLKMKENALLRGGGHMARASR